ncbi:SPASM domain-containing protein [Fluviispira multicolorata]|uniref:SPASM domain-containing protein n=1 Tax=Fluviispira multicolorata TaxID=2654512 RepID=UPI001B86C706
MICHIKCINTFAIISGFSALSFFKAGSINFTNRANESSKAFPLYAIDKTKRSVFSDFYDAGVFENFSCNTCTMLPVCGGGCPKSWKENIQACPTPKFNISQRLLLYYAYNRIREY